MTKPWEEIFKRDLTAKEDDRVLEAIAASPQAASRLAEMAEAAYKATGYPSPMKGLPWRRRIRPARLAMALAGLCGLGLVSWLSWEAGRHSLASDSTAIHSRATESGWPVVRDEVRESRNAAPRRRLPPAAPAARPVQRDGVESPALQAPANPVRPTFSQPDKSLTYNRLAAIIHLSAPAVVEARVLDSQGLLLRKLVRRPFPAGTHRLEWDGRLADGSLAGAADYFLEIRADGKTLRKPVQILPASEP